MKSGENLRPLFFQGWENVYSNIIKSLQTNTDLSRAQFEEIYNALHELNLEIFNADSFDESIYQELQNFSIMLGKHNMPDLESDIHYFLSPISNSSMEILSSSLISDYLSYRDAESLLCTNSFFSNDLYINDAMKRKDSGLTLLKCTYNHSFFWDEVNKKLYWYGNNTGGMMLLTLPDTELPADIATTAKTDGFILVSTKSGNLYKYYIGQADCYTLELTYNKITLPDNEAVLALFDSHDDQIWYSMILSASHKVYEYRLLPNGEPGDASLNKIVMPENEKVIDIVYDSPHSFLLCESKNIFALGDNCYGQLGLGIYPVPARTPQLIVFPDNDIPKSIVTHDDRTFVICESNHCYAFGRNKYGSLGIKNRDESCPTPTRLVLPDSEVPLRIIPGNRCGIVLCQNGNMYLFGENVINVGHLPKLLPSPKDEIVIDVMFSRHSPGDPNDHTTSAILYCKSGNYYSRAIWPMPGFKDNQYHLFMLDINDKIKLMKATKECIYVFRKNGNFHKYEIVPAAITAHAGLYDSVRTHKDQWKLKRSAKIPDLTVELNSKINPGNKYNSLKL